MTDPIPPAAEPAPQYTQPATPYATPATVGPRTNTLAIIALIGAFVVPLAGIICGFISLGQIKRTGEAGHGMALAGVILGFVFSLLYILLFVFAFVLPLIFWNSMNGVVTSY